ncbi:MAG: hypothetical protein JO211_03085 [Acidobacteriaceae bacterium]|nr:hypothetical protein [Acidobacteriaceae bacterium]
MAETLVELAIKLSIAASEMAEVAGVSRDPAFSRAKLEAERLRDECEHLQSELARHRLQHGC